MRVLVMGGSQFNGYSLVMELVKHGHEITVLNRGRTAVDFPRSVRRLVADRTDHDQVRAVLGGESFDAVQDMSAYHPADVELMIEVFEGRIGHYIFASSTVIYAPTDILPITENHPVDRGPNQNEYGLHKLLCEDILIDAWRSRGFPATTVPVSTEAPGRVKARVTQPMKPRPSGWAWSAGWCPATSSMKRSASSPGRCPACPATALPLVARWPTWPTTCWVSARPSPSTMASTPCS